jgi:hypothetical protein
MAIRGAGRRSSRRQRMHISIARVDLSGIPLLGKGGRARDAQSPQQGSNACKVIAIPSFHLSSFQILMLVAVVLREISVRSSSAPCAIFHWT